MSRPALDVAALPTHAFGPRATLWWGVVTMLCIESVALLLTAIALLYVRGNFPGWPPAGTAPPRLTAATLDTAVLLLSLLPMRLAERAARSRERFWTAAIFGFMALVGLACCALRYFELAALNCRWDDHAYGSAVWLLVGMHTAHLIGATLENGLLAAVIVGPVEPKHYVDADSNAFYWYFIVFGWLPVYALVYLWPRWT